MKEENFKANMANKCVDCKAERTCPYSAKKIYLEDDLLNAPLCAVDANPTKENLAKAITTGHYVRCVYNCDNNVVDHMVSILEFEYNITATFNSCASTNDGTRTIKLMFSHREVAGDFKNK